MASDHTAIEWTDATWNPVTGCAKVSPGCAHCYAEGVAHRFWATQYPPVRKSVGAIEFANLDGSPATRPRVFTDVMCHEDRLDQPLKWREPRRIFVNSMSDLFHEDVPFEFIAAVFGVMGASDRHTFQVLTKRPARMLAFSEWLRAECRHRGDFTMAPWQIIEEEATERVGNDRFPAHLPDVPWPLPNVWLGVSVENQRWADERIPMLLQTPAAVRFVSAEPLLGPVDLDPLRCDMCGGAKVTWGEPGSQPWCVECDHEMGSPGWLDGLDLVIVGGESGKGARPMHPDWARSLRDQCAAAGVKFFFKQWGEWAPATREHGIVGHVMPDTGRTKSGIECRWIGGDGATQFPSFHGLVEPIMAIARVGKKDAGRLLDGREWSEFPEGVPGVV